MHDMAGNAFSTLWMEHIFDGTTSKYCHSIQAVNNESEMAEAGYFSVFLIPGVQLK